MRRSSILGAASVAALAAGALAVSSGTGSSHREAPSILGDPTADNTDLYAFTAPDAPRHLTIVSNWIPFEDPSGGPYFGKLDPKARYYVKIDNTGDGREDVAYRWQFSQKFRNPNSFLYAAPTVDSVDDPDINFVQTYDLYRETYNRKGELTRSLRIANDLPVAPDNVGPKTIPDYAQGRPRARRRRSRTAASPSSARPTTRSSSTSPRCSTASTSTSRAVPPSAWATRAAARTTWPATTRTRSRCRCPSPR